MICTLPKGPTVERTMDATHLNRVANHADVRPWLGGEGPIDLQPLLANPAHVAFVTPHGGFVLLADGYQRYEVHSMFLPEGRGGEAMTAMRAVAEYMFTRTDATEGLTKVPVANRAADALALRAGFELRFTSSVPWQGATCVPMRFYALTLERWVARSVRLLEVGAWFHQQMQHLKNAGFTTLPPHSDDDETHDRMAGAAILMAQAGQLAKAERLYNAWARFTGYPPIQVLRDHPPIIDLGGIVVEVWLNEMEILSCQ